jgi:hypothetical protein
MEHKDPMSMTPTLSINLVQSQRKNKHFDLPIILSSAVHDLEEVGTRALVDSGAKQNFIYVNFAKMMGL